MNLRNALFASLLLISTLQVNAQVRKYSNEFLSIGVGGRGLAMSGAQVASVNDVTAAFYNPAGLAGITNDFQLGLMHAEYFAGIAKYDYGGVAIPLKGDNGVIGVSLIRFAVDDIPNTLELYNADGTIDYNNVKSFSVGDYGFFLSYARTLMDNENSKLSLGGNTKIVYRKAGSFANAWGFGLDVGLQYELNNWRFGFMGQDISGTFNAWSFSFTDNEKQVLQATGNEVPESSLEVTVPKLIFAAAYKYELKEKFTVTPEVDFTLTTDGKRNVIIPGDPISVDMDFGLELGYADVVYLRGGVGNIQQIKEDSTTTSTSFQPTIGVGLNIKAVSIDYAYTDIGNQSEGLYSHVIGLRVRFDRKTE